MKSQKGITLTSIVIYVIVLTMVVGIIATITSFFYANTMNMNDSATNLGEFNKFNAAFLMEIKKVGNSIYKIENENERIIFSSGTAFTYQDGGIYQNKVKICTGVTNCKFSTRKQEEKQIVSVLIEIGKNAEFAKTIEYVMGYDNIFKTADWNEAIKKENVVTEGNRKAVIPNGYVASKVTGENTISGGLVIYEGNEEVTSSNHEEAMKTRNQYVWIPVDDINQMVMCKSNTASSVCNLVLQANGTLKCEKHNSEELCGRLYGVNSTSTKVDEKKVYSTNMNFADRSQTWTASSYREPDIVSDKDTDSTTGGLATFTANMTNDFKTMANSVATYGGFYVSRYEVGAGGSSKQGQTVLNAGASSANTWYGLYNTLRGTNKHMIWGSQYDQIIHFTDEEEAQTGHIDKQTTTPKVSGYEGDTDIMKNIYDLEGNFREWTAQANLTLSRVPRGGDYYDANLGSFFSASNRLDDYSDHANGHFSSRRVLYM